MSSARRCGLAVATSLDIRGPAWFGLVKVAPQPVAGTGPLFKVGCGLKPGGVSPNAAYCARLVRHPGRWVTKCPISGAFGNPPSGGVERNSPAADAITVPDPGAGDRGLCTVAGC